MLLEAMAEVDAAPDATLMIGDSNFDMAMARAAGCHALGVASGFQPVAALIEAGAHAIAATPGDLLPACLALPRPLAEAWA